MKIRSLMSLTGMAKSTTRIGAGTDFWLRSEDGFFSGPVGDMVLIV